MTIIEAVIPLGILVFHAQIELFKFRHIVPDGQGGRADRLHQQAGIVGNVGLRPHCKFQPAGQIKNATAPCWNSCPMMPFVDSPGPSRQKESDRARLFTPSARTEFLVCMSCPFYRHMHRVDALLVLGRCLATEGPAGREGRANLPEPNPFQTLSG